MQRIDLQRCMRWWFYLNPGNCECECDKSRDVREYLDYKNCKCRKKLVDRLTEECTENTEEVKIASENDHKNKCGSCILCIVMFSIFFAINIGTGAYFVYYKYMNRNEENVSGYDYVYQAKNININGRSQTNKYQKSNLFFLQRHDQFQKFRIRLVKNRQNELQRD